MAKHKNNWTINKIKPRSTQNLFLQKTLVIKQKQPKIIQRCGEFAIFWFTERKCGQAIGYAQHFALKTVSC